MICWHRWTKWKVVGGGLLQVQYDAVTGRRLDENEKYVTGVFTRQERECEKCGQLQLRRTTA